jgi:ABC-2 type transport system permease protein
MDNFFRGIIRSSAFIQKEINDILRQPQLILTLVLGPFLILFIFGVGYHNQARPLNTLFVAQPNSAFAQNIQQIQKSIGSTLVLSGITSDQNEALNRLRRGEVDLVIVVPDDAYTTILNNQQAVFTLYYGEIDPIQVSYIQYIGVLYSETVNHEVLRSITEQAQKNTANLHNDLQQAHQNLSTLRQAVQSGDNGTAQQKQQSVNSNIDAITLAVGASLDFLSSVQQTNGATGGNTDQLQNTIKDLQQNNAQLNDGSSTSQDQRLAKIDKMDKDITDLDTSLTKFQKIDPAVIINPFRSVTKSIANVQPSESDFFTPAVLALLLQHLAVTFAALSIVRERSSGTMELFRVSPLSAGEALFGKYISYLLFGVVVAAILSALLIFGLHLPMLGSWVYFSLAVLAVLFTSLGIGFIISIISQTDSQAVQFSMIVLLASVFFGGFFINLDYLTTPVKVISWLLPTTYGTAMLRDITLRGNPPSWLLLGGLVAIGLALMLISWMLLRRYISSGGKE